MEKNFPDIQFIKGWVRTSLIDYPGKIATVVYTGGCNLRCPFCHNPELLQSVDSYESISLTEILEFLNLRKGVVDGIVISGGEPLIHPQIIDLLHLLRAFDINIKLDTNGCFPERLQEILKNQLVDMVAMDIKASRDQYSIAVGIKSSIVEKIEESLAILKSSPIPFELRTTIIPNLHTQDIIAELTKWIAPVDHYCLQQFRPEVTLDPEYRDLKPLSESALLEMLNIARKHIPDTLLRGLNS